MDCIPREYLSILSKSIRASGNGLYHESIVVNRGQPSARPQGSGPQVHAGKLELSSLQSSNCNPATQTTGTHACICRPHAGAGSVLAMCCWSRVAHAAARHATACAERTTAHAMQGNAVSTQGRASEVLSLFGLPRLPRNISIKGMPPGGPFCSSEASLPPDPISLALRG